MLRSGARVRRRWRWALLGLATLLVAFAGQADARSRHYRHHATRSVAASYDPAYASIVIDANSGAVLRSNNADSPRHPASLTKIMTLYLLFERLEAGKIKLTTELAVSPHAAAQAPSKLGLEPGDTISVETAIRAIVTKSANDVAVIIAEAIGGSEEHFASMMTAKARELGMMHTTYRNASGLPDDQQITTARDVAILGRAIQDRFPEYYHYFATRNFVWHGHLIRNHNHLLGNVPGVDGIKTGYIHDSGFNIVTSVRRQNRHIVAVVFGGHTANARDAQMRSLIDKTINIAATKRTAPMVVEGWEKKTVAQAKPAEPAKEPAVKQPETAPAVGSTEPLKPNPVKTFTVQPGAVHAASLSPLPAASRKLLPMPATAPIAAITTVATVKSEPALPLPVAPSPAEAPAKPAEVASAAAIVPLPDPAPPRTASAKPQRGTWVIQVGAFDSQTEAVERLSTVQNGIKELLAQATPLTERVEKGDKAFYRARFTGLEKSQAESACKNLKRSDIPCMLLKN